MFGNKNSEANSGTSKNMLISNRINHGTSMTGEMVSDGDIRIEGAMSGTLKCKAKVAVGPSGKIEGDIYCKSAEVEGKIIGDIEVTDTLLLRSTAVVDGNIHTGKIIIENGAQFNGMCSMGGKEKRKNVEEAITKALQAETVN
jgi:cytoskeletal protein CcmA (bactofilin family)